MGEVGFDILAEFLPDSFGAFAFYVALVVVVTILISAARAAFPDL